MTNQVPTQTNQPKEAIMLNDNTNTATMKYLSSPSGDDTLEIEASYINGYLKEIENYALSLKDNGLDGYTSSTLHDASYALHNLVSQASATLDALHLLQNTVDSLAYDKEDEESDKAESAKAWDKHMEYINKWFNSTRI